MNCNESPINTPEFNAIVNHVQEQLPEYFQHSHYYLDKNRLHLMDLQTGTIKHRIWLEGSILHHETSVVTIRNIPKTRQPYPFKPINYTTDIANPTSLQELTNNILLIDQLTQEP